jgi:hypothetical protein
MTRKALAELGYTSPMSELPAWKADCFAAIALGIEEFKAKKLEQMKMKRK